MRWARLFPVHIDQPVSRQSVHLGAEVVGSLAVDLVQNSRSVQPAGTSGPQKYHDPGTAIPYPHHGSGNRNLGSVWPGFFTKSR